MSVSSGLLRLADGAVAVPKVRGPCHNAYSVSHEFMTKWHSTYHPSVAAMSVEVSAAPSYH